MARHTGVSLALSVLVVGFFAVLLYQPDRTPPRPIPGPGAPTAGPSSETRPATRGEASPEPGAIAAPAAAVAHAPIGLGAGPPSTAGVGGAPGPGGPRRASSDRPRSPFTEVGPGESLADVAARVYGTTASVPTIWKSNRDILAGQDAPLRAGMVLRTP